VLWRIAIDTGWLSPHALVEDTIYAMSQMGVYAINAHNGEVYWLYQPDEHTIMSGPLVVADHLLYVGTSGSVAHPEKSYCCALDTEKGTEHWRCPMGSYIGAVIHNESIYVSSGDRYLCWLLIISVRSIRPLRALSHVSRNLPMPQRKSTIEMLSSAHLQKG
jgi:outer membrane protein assembly factor BamB